MTTTFFYRIRTVDFAVASIDGSGVVVRACDPPGRFR